MANVNPKRNALVALSGRISAFSLSKETQYFAIIPRPKCHI